MRNPLFVNQEVASKYAVPFVAEMHRVQSLQLSFGPLTDSEMTTLRSMFTTVRRSTNPLLLAPERDGTDAYFGRIISQFSERVESQRYTALEFVEDSYGNRL